MLHNNPDTADFHLEEHTLQLFWQQRLLYLFTYENIMLIRPHNLRPKHRLQTHSSTNTGLHIQHTFAINCKKKINFLHVI